MSGICATVFGASGFLGRYVVNALARQGSQVVIPYRCDDLDVQHLRPMGDLGQIVMMKDFDVFDDEQVKKAVSRSNLVINLLGQDKETMNFSFEDVHIEAARKVATAAAANGLLERYMHVSCLAASPDHTSRRLRTKAEGERLTQEIVPEATIFKAAQMTGVEDRLLNALAGMVKKFPFVPLIDGGGTRLQPTFVRDVADAVVGSLNSRDTAGKTYHLAGPEVLSIEDIVRLTFDTMRENYKALPVPHALAKLLGQPREYLKKYAQIPVNTMFTVDYADEMQMDAVLPASGVLTYADLGITPRKVTMGLPIEHIRHLRSGGYDMGTTSQEQSTGGAGY